jgi:Divergent InlB B-repeat domain
MVARGVPYSSSVIREPGCVIIDNSACGYSVHSIRNEGVRGTVTAVPKSGRRFLYWSSSSGCAGETTNPCAFVYDRNKTIIAVFY